jgi:hypothetical protein
MSHDRCSGCATGHAGAAFFAGKTCEGCQLKQPSFGLPAEGKARWCSGCAKAHAGAVNISSKKCEGCGEKAARLGLPSDGKKRRWCGDCAPKAALAGGGPAHAGASLQKMPKATGPPLNHFRPLDLCSGSRYRLALGNLYEAAPVGQTACFKTAAAA